MVKVPPHNIEAEQSVLGALMIDRDAIIQVADILTTHDFYKPTHSKIFETILSLYEKHEPIDIVCVTSKLRVDGTFEDVGGTAYLTELINLVPTAAHVEHYANIVHEKRVLRNLISAAGEITEAAFDPGDDLEHLLNNVEQKIFSIAQHSKSQRFISVKTELAGAYERIETIHRNPGSLRGITTGFPDLDGYLSGLHPSDLIILGARPSLGKTSLALDIARNVAIKEKKTVGIFSLEMSKEQVIDRIIAAEARVSLWNLRTGRLKNEVDFQLIQAALDSLSQTKMFIDDTPSPTILQMRSVARRLQAEHGLDLIVVDYLQLITPRLKGSDNTVAQVTEISRGLKILARELNIPVLALSQLSRGVDQRDQKVPRLSDLRDSGSIEQDADVVLFIYRKDRDKQSPDIEEINSAEIIVAKHRNGPTGSVKLRFDPERASFDTLDRYHNPPTTAV